MFLLERSLQAWNTPGFNDEFKCEVSKLDEKSLPLQAGLSFSSVAISDKLNATVLESRIACSEDGDYIYVKAGLFYEGIIAGCNCSDDPSPIDRTTEYCEAVFHIDMQTAQTTVSLLQV